VQNVIFVASDFHYGENQTEVLAPFLKLLAMAKDWNASLILNGDLFNYWFESKGQIPTSCEPFIDGLKNAIDNGLNVTVLRGNRDFLMHNEFIKKTGAHLIQADEFVLKEFNVIITHGDQYDSSLKYRIYRKVIRSKFTRFMINQVSISFLMKVIHFLRKKGASTVGYVYQLPLNVKCPNDFRVVLGHYHQENIRKLENGFVLFCPAFDTTPKVLKITKNDFEFLKVV
jgi:UDP-2,3-diacylglucosamine pyrophosphatase LpxH